MIFVVNLPRVYANDIVARKLQFFFDEEQLIELDIPKHLTEVTLEVKKQPNRAELVDVSREGGFTARKTVSWEGDNYPKRNVTGLSVSPRVTIEDKPAPVLKPTSKFKFAPETPDGHGSDNEV